MAMLNGAGKATGSLWICAELLAPQCVGVKRGPHP